MFRSGWFGLGAAIALGIAAVWSTYVMGGAIVRARGADEMVRVTGSARKEIRSDFIIWSGTVSYRGRDISSAFAATRKGIGMAQAYLLEKGVAKDQIVISAAQTNPVYSTVKQTVGGEVTESQQITGYDVVQNIEVRSSEVDKVDRISREVTDLIERGVNFTSMPPKFLYTKIGDVKVEILAEAAKDARRRAEEISKSSGATLTDVRFARMSPLQITPLYSTEVTYDGQNDTTSVDKAITAIVTMGFGVR